MTPRRIALSQTHGQPYTIPGDRPQHGTLWDEIEAWISADERSLAIVCYHIEKHIYGYHMYRREILREPFLKVSQVTGLEDHEQARGQAQALLEATQPSKIVVDLVYTETRESDGEGGSYQVEQLLSKNYGPINPRLLGPLGICLHHGRRLRLTIELDPEDPEKTT